MTFVDDFGRPIVAAPNPLAGPIDRQAQANRAQQLFDLQRQYPELYGQPSQIAPPSAPTNPIDRFRNWVTSADWYRRLKPEAQRFVTGPMEAAEYTPPVAAARGGYEAGTALAESDYGKAALELATTVPGLGKVAAAGKAAAAAKPAIFAGILAKTADRDAYNLAQKMAREGATPSDIHAATGWFQGADDKWRFEIPDQPSKFVEPGTPNRLQLAEQIHREELGGTKTPFSGQEPELDKRALAEADKRIASGAASTPLGQVLEHPALYEAYPGLADIPTTRSARGNLRGSYAPGELEEITYGGGTVRGSTDQERSTLLHEAQHAIQEREGFAKGGNPMAFGPDAVKLYKERLAAIQTPLSLEEYAQRGGFDSIEAAKAAYPDYLKETQNALKGPMGPMLDRAAQETAAQQAYRRQAGEVEARNVQYRRGYSPEEIRDVPPFYTEDVPRSQQFVNRRYTGPAASAITPTQQVRAATIEAAAAQQRAEQAATGVAAEPLGTTRISQRVPTGISTEDPLKQNLLINTSVLQRDPEKVAQAAQITREYPNLTPTEREMSPGEQLQALGKHAKENILALWDMTPEGIRARASGWYEGAHNIANTAAARTGVDPRAAAGTYAALSPQKDWYQNVYLGDQVLNTLKTNPAFTPDMKAAAAQIPAFQKSGVAEQVASMEGKRLSDLSPADKAVFIRLFDEAHGPRQYRTVTPEGGFGPLVTKADGTPAKPGWGSFNEIEKAVRSAESGGDTSIISPLMGDKHKVRNFYNNIAAPNAPASLGDITVDTHQIAASLFRPLSGGSREVIQGLQTGSKGIPAGPVSAASGLQGLYPLYADATRAAAAERGVPVRAMQSVPWETIRGIYQPKFKAQASNVAGIDTIWGRYRAGEISADEARRQSLAAAGGYRPPTWYGR